MKIVDTKTDKFIWSDDYKLTFNKKNGFTARWGKTQEDDPQYCPYGPEILDLEISSASEDDWNNMSELQIVTNHGCHGVGCRQFCYKANKQGGSVHMSLDTFKQIMDRMPKTLCSIAFGVLSPIEQHPQVWEIFEECRNRGVIPNVTINQKVSDEVADKLAHYCGAVAVSVNPRNKEIAYDTIYRLSYFGEMNQVNIHIVLSNDSVDFIKEVVDDMKSDMRLAFMNALVMLSFKDKACTHAMTPISTLAYREVVDYCQQAKVNFGFDSCGANVFTEVCPELAQFAEPCESLLFSAYIDVNAKLYACSFTEKMGMWQEGIDVLAHDTFLEIWNSEKVQQWRDLLIGLNGRSCPEYTIGG